MDVDWAESQLPSAELRVGERVPGFPACVRARSATAEQHAVRVDLDVDALSAALAHALVTAPDGRILSRSSIAPAVQPSAPVAPKRSFWAGAWHADVVLASIAILVVVAVLLARTV